VRRAETEKIRIRRLHGLTQINKEGGVVSYVNS